VRNDAEHPPPHDPPCEDIDHERHIDEAVPRGDVRQIRDPELIRALPRTSGRRGSGGRPAVGDGWVVVTQCRARTAPAWCPHPMIRKRRALPNRNPAPSRRRQAGA
jgi:hypothetical protein